MRRQPDSPQIDPHYHSETQQDLPQPIRLFKEYVLMLRRNAETKKFAKDERERIINENKRKEEEINYLKTQVEEGQNLQLQVYQTVQSADQSSMWTCCRYNAVLILTLLAIILTIIWSHWPYLPTPHNGQQIIAPNRTLCSFTHPEGWLCRMPEEQRAARYQIVNKQWQLLEDKEIQISDVPHGEHVRRCGKKSNEFASVNLAWKQARSSEKRGGLGDECQTRNEAYGY